jgi:hypothetical protein
MFALYSLKLNLNILKFLKAKNNFKFLLLNLKII